MYEIKNNSGALFANKDKKDKQPDLTGSAVVNGKKMRIAAWRTVSKNGLKYLSIKFSEYLETDGIIDELKEDTTDNSNDFDDMPF